MILLTSSSDLLEVVTGASVSDIYVQASFVDLSSVNVLTPGRQNTIITTATTTTVVPSPAAGTNRALKNLCIFNSSASPCQVSILHTDGTNSVEIFNYTTQTGESIYWSEGRGFYVQDANGNFKTGSTTTAAGSNGDIQYNNNGITAGSAATATAAGTIDLPAGQVLQFGTDTGISRDSAGVVDIGNGTAADVSGTIKAATAVIEYNGIGNQGSGNTPVSALIVQNTTAAITGAGNMQYPPSIEQDGQYWTGLASAKGQFIQVAHFGTGASMNWTLQMIGLASVAYAITLKNMSAALSSQNCAPPNFNLVGAYWNGAASAQETWSLALTLGSGSNPTSKLSVVHNGTSGQATLDLSNGGALGTSFIVLVPTASSLDNSTKAASTAYTDSAVAVETSRAETAEALKAPLASPALTGTPTAPTASALTNNTQLATTGYTDAAVSAAVAVGKVPILVFSQSVTGLTTSDATHETIFTATAGKIYRCTAILTCTATGTSGSTMSVTVRCGTTPSIASNTLANTALSGGVASIGGLFGVTSGNLNAGFNCTLSGTIGTATYRIDFFVEQLA